MISDVLHDPSHAVAEAAPLVPAQGELRAASAVTVERIERAIPARRAKDELLNNAIKIAASMIRAAKKAGAADVEIKTEQASVRIPLVPDGLVEEARDARSVVQERIARM